MSTLIGLCRLCAFVRYQDSYLHNERAVGEVDRLGAGGIAVAVKGRIAFEGDRVGDQLSAYRAPRRGATAILDCVRRKVDRPGDIGTAAAVDLIAAAWTADPILKKGNPRSRTGGRGRQVESEVSVDLHIRGRAARIVGQDDRHPTRRAAAAARRRIDGTALKRQQALVDDVHARAEVQGLVAGNLDPVTEHISLRVRSRYGSAPAKIVLVAIRAGGRVRL